MRPLQHRAAGLLLWARRRVGDIDRLLHGRRAAANPGSAAFSATQCSRIRILRFFRFQKNAFLRETSQKRKKSPAKVQSSILNSK